MHLKGSTLIQYFRKHGIFYYAYGENALVLSGICNYQFKDNRCGFPIKSLEKLLVFYLSLKSMFMLIICF